VFETYILVLKFDATFLLSIVFYCINFLFIFHKILNFEAY